MYYLFPLSSSSSPLSRKYLGISFFLPALLSSLVCLLVRWGAFGSVFGADCGRIISSDSRLGFSAGKAGLAGRSGRGVLGAVSGGRAGGVELPPGGPPTPRGALGVAGAEGVVGGVGSGFGFRYSSAVEK